MLGYARGHEFHNVKGGIESIIFMDSEDVVLSGDGQSTVKRVLKKGYFEDEIDKQHFVPKLVEKPHLQLTQYQKDIIEDRLQYMSELKKLVKGGMSATIESTYHELITQVEKVYPATLATKHPAWKTVCRWWRAWVKTEFDDVALACKKRKCITKLNTPTEAFLQDYISKVYSDSNSTFKKAFYNDYTDLVKQDQVDNPSLHVASRRTFYRRLNELSQVEQALNIKGLTQAERNQRLLTLQRKIKTYFAMQRVECDRVCLNMCLIDDETGMPTPPVNLYLALDVYTRCPLAVLVSFDAENKENGLNLLRQIYLADPNLSMSGKPVTLIMDNGAGFNNELVQKAGERLNTTIIYAPSNQPAKKPFVESFFNVLRDEFFSGMKVVDTEGNYTIGFNSYYPKRTSKKTRDVDDLAKHANIKVSDFKKLLNTHLTEYIHKVHGSTGIAPLESWKQSLSGTSRPHYSYSDVQHCFHVCVEKPTHKLYARGIVRCLKQDYFSDELKAIYSLLKQGKLDTENPDVKVYFDPFDARTVTVSAILPGDIEATEYTAYNIDLHDAKHAISFDELHGFKPKSQDIWQKVKHIPQGRYQCVISEFVNQKRRPSPPRGPKIPSFKENTENGLNASERIAKAHKTDTKLNNDIKPNLPCLEQTPQEETTKQATTKPKISEQNKLMDGDELW